MPESLDQFDRLQTGVLYFFRDWPNAAVPRAAAGVYTIWDGDVFLYAGMAGRGAGPLSPRPGGRPTGLFSRLASHAAGRRSGDQFCVYVGDRLVLPALSVEQIAQIAAGQLSLDRLIRKYIHERLGYRFILADSGTAALALERLIQTGGLKAGRPVLNPVHVLPGPGRRLG